MWFFNLATLLKISQFSYFLFSSNIFSWKLLNKLHRTNYLIKTERNFHFLLIPVNRGASHVTFGFLQFDWLEIWFHFQISLFFLSILNWTIFVCKLHSPIFCTVFREYSRRISRVLCRSSEKVFEANFRMWVIIQTAMAAHKGLRNKLILAKKQKQNRPVPNWFRFKPWVPNHLVQINNNCSPIDTRVPS